MSFLNGNNLKRYIDIVRLFRKHGLGDAVREAGKDNPLKEEIAETLVSGPSKPEELAAELERMGPTYVKLGQMLSTRPDMLPRSYIEALARLQDKVEPIPYEEVAAVFAEETGLAIESAFRTVDPTPIASASLGQVHRAEMHDGRRVAVKIQRPGARERISQDFEALSHIVEFLDQHTEMGRKYEFRKMFMAFRASMARELDYRLEAENMRTMSKNLEEFDRILVPLPVEELSTQRVLTMDYVRGTKVTSISPLAKIEMDGVGLADQLSRAYMKQLCVDGFMHADPHPGNVFLTDAGHLALLDFGMVVRISGGLQERLLQLLLALSEGRGEAVAGFAIDIGEPRENFNKTDFQTRILELVQQRQGRVKDSETGQSILETARVAGECGISIPSELTMVGQTLLKLDQVTRILHPGFDANQAIRKNALVLTQKRLLKGVTLGAVLNMAFEGKNFLEHLPLRANRILENLANNELKIQVESIDENRLMEGAQKVANRITLGLVLAALIIGAALLMRVETSFRIFGYPGLAIGLFVLAVLGGAALVFSMLRHDVKHLWHR